MESGGETELSGFARGCCRGFQFCGGSGGQGPGGEVLSLSKDTIGLSSLARHCSPEPEAPPRLGGFAGPSAIPRRTGLRVV